MPIHLLIRKVNYAYTFLCSMQHKSLGLIYFCETSKYKFEKGKWNNKVIYTQANVKELN